MNLLMWLILGLGVGYVGHLLLSADPDRGCLMNVLVGTVGALWAGRLMAAHLSAGATASAVGIQTTGVVCLVSLLVAVVLVALANLLRSGRLR